MRKRSGAGALSERIDFQELAEGDDGYGGVTVGWETKLTKEFARLEPRMGSEPVIAARLQGLQPYTLTVRSSTLTRAVTPAWRAVNTRSGAVYAIKSVVNIDERNQWIEMLVVAGEAG